MKNKILLLTSRFPFPPIGGDKLRFFHVLKHLSKTNEITIVYFSDHNFDQTILDDYRTYFSESYGVVLPKIRSYLNCILGLLNSRPLQVSYYRSGKMAKLINNKISTKKFDLIWVHLVRMTEYVKRCASPRMLDMTDAQSLNYLRAKDYRQGIWSFINNVEKALIKRYEQKIWKYFDNTYVVSPIDKHYLKQLDNKMRVEVLPNGVDIEKYKYKMNNHTNKKICFIGNMRTFPNTDAAVWFGQKIFPTIKKRIHNAKLYVVGTEPSKTVRHLSKIKDIVITGEVHNIHDYVYDASVSIAPMRVAAGIQNKILESMALGTPVVSTSIGVEGIECTPGEDVLIADTEEDFVNQVVRLLEDKNLKIQISRDARKNIEENYTWEKMLKKIDDVIESIRRTS